jgi:hypothetical protein
MTRRSSARTFGGKTASARFRSSRASTGSQQGQSGQGTYSQRPGWRRKRRYRSSAWLTQPGYGWRASALAMTFCALRPRPRIGVGGRAAAGWPARTVPGALRGIGPSSRCHAAILPCLFLCCRLTPPSPVFGEINCTDVDAFNLRKTPTQDPAYRPTRPATPV